MSQFLDSSLRPDVRKIRRDVYELISQGESGVELAVLKSLYDGEIAWVDSCIEDLVVHFESLGLDEETVIIVTADHGDLLGEHGLLHHEFVLYEPLIKVPFIMRFPDLFEKGERYDGLVQTLDIMPTLLDYLHIDWHSNSQEAQGRSIFEMISGSEREYAISERADWSSKASIDKIDLLESQYPNFNWRRYVQEIVALRTRDYKHIWSSEGRHELYDLKHDPQETHNLVAIDKVKASELRIRTEAWMGSFLREEAIHSDLEGSVKERLRALGYL
jgi:arylsulfatase A-like enzyme